MPRNNTPSWRSSFAAVALLATICALVVALTAGAAGAAPERAAAGASPTADASAAKCVALIQKGKKLVSVYEKVYKYKFVKVKGKKSFQRKIVKVRQKMRVPCAKQCVLLKKKKGKNRPVYHVIKVKVKVPRHGRLVTVKKRVRTYRFTKCKAKSGANLGTPVTINILDESKAILDFGAFQREAPLSGQLKGFVPGGINLSADSQITLTKGNIILDPTAVFIDDDCKGKVSAAIRTGTGTNVTLDKTRTSTSTVFSTGTVTSTAYTVVRVPLELRNDDTGCDSPYITTGYSEFKQTFFLKGKLDPKLALAKLKLVSAPDLVDVPVCLSPGVPTDPCNGFEIPLPVQISTQLYVQVKLG
jgi:hypothetical protein